MGRNYPEGEIRLAGLTDKQREVLDLLLQHKTSKEIARTLRISPHTVDQRVQFAKEKLGATTRSEVAVAYRRLVEIYGQMTYEDSPVSQSAFDGDEDGGTRDPLTELNPPERTQPERQMQPASDYRVVPELFEGRWGTLMRLGAIIMIAVFLTILVLGGLAMFSQLSEMMAS